MDKPTAQQEKLDAQNAQYSFPYHYIPAFDGGVFRLTRTMRWGYEYLSYIEFLAAEAKTYDFGRLLDVGCGDGRLLHELARTTDASRLTGVDYSKEAISLATILTPNVTFHAADITTDDSFGSDYDVMTSSEVLEHIPPDFLPQFVEAMRRKIASDGVLLVTVPCSNIPVTAKHFQHFSEESLKAALAPHFEISKLSYLNSNSWMVRRVIEKLFVNRWFSIRHPSITTRLYRLYCQRYLHASSTSGRRLYAVCRPV